MHPSRWLVISLLAAGCGGGRQAHSTGAAIEADGAARPAPAESPTVAAAQVETAATGPGATPVHAALQDVPVEEAAPPERADVAPERGEERPRCAVMRAVPTGCESARSRGRQRVRLAPGVDGERR